MVVLCNNLSNKENTHQYVIFIIFKKLIRLSFFFSADVGTMFALPWYLTWFGHSLNRYKDVVRLYDYFLATAPLMPLYVATSLVIYRRDEVFAQGKNKVNTKKKVFFQQYNRF